MHFLHVALLITAWLIAFVWLYKLIEAAIGLPSLANLLAPTYDAAPVRGPSIAVIVPARDEAAELGACLESLIGQDYENVRIIGVDDRSTDATGAIMDRLAHAHGERFGALHIASLPVGWLGKPHAMVVGAQDAIEAHDPDWLLFTDGDVVFRPEAIRRALMEAAASHADHLVVLPSLIAKTWGEAMLLSHLQVMGMWAVRPWRVDDPRAMRDAVGVGAFNLVRTGAYRQLGGFEAAPMEILEDVEFGRRVKRAGMRQRVAIAPGMICVHWAAGVWGIVNGMTKNMFSVFRFRVVTLLAATVGLVASCVAPVIFLGVPGVRIPAILTLAAIGGHYVLFQRISRISAFYAAFFPIGAVLVIYTMLRSMIITQRNGGVTWRGTFYPLAELRSSAEKIAK